MPAERRSVVESITERIVIEKGPNGAISIELAHLQSSEELTERQRDLIRSLPMCHLRLACSKPMSCAYPKELKTLGDRIRRRRLDLGMFQRDVAERVGVNETTILNWEKNRTQPTKRHISGVVVFLC
jgi:hypothetical protein